MAVTESFVQDKTRIDFDQFPRVGLCHLNTPIEAMPRLSEHLGGPRLFIKRDDCTGLAMGGNKTRKLEFLVGEAMQERAELIGGTFEIDSVVARGTEVTVTMPLEGKADLIA